MPGPCGVVDGRRTAAAAASAAARVSLSWQDLLKWLWNAVPEQHWSTTGLSQSESDRSTQSVACESASLWVRS